MSEGVSMSLDATSAAHRPADPAADLRSLRELIAALEHAQTNELVDAFVRLFRSDAIWTTGHGRRLTGREAIASFTAEVLPGASADGRATYEIEHVMFIRPDVAAVKVIQRSYDRNGRPAGIGSPMYVAAKEDGRWLLTASQNTIVIAE
jgi:uncharacterized protein (TIGR02246 family)